ncbi:MAG TPA: hypothetical protein VMV22_04580 [Acidimicrobiales bacterium]|nr:hypothetical protein [Acidimicrobiales bacterium]
MARDNPGTPPPAVLPRACPGIPPFRRLLRKAHGRLWIAGDHTETLADSVESAVRCGHRFASTIWSPPR